MQIQSQEWAIRPAGSSGWIPIDPDSPRGRFLAAQHGFTTTPQKERLTMSAIPIETETTRRVRVVSDADPATLGLAAGLKEKASAAYAWMAALPQHAIAALRRIVPDSVATRAATAWGWTKAKVMAVFHMLGKTGALGAGMLVISTGDGRRLLNLAVTPVRWGVSLFVKVWTKVEDVLYVEEPSSILDRARNFVSERMADLREFLFGSGTRENRYGFVGNLAVKALLKVGPFLELDSKTMLTTRGIGAAVLGVKLFTLVPLLPVAGWIAFLIQGFVAISTLVGAGEPLLQVAEQVTGLRRPTATKAEGQAAAKVAATVTDLPPKTAPATPHRQPQRSGGKPSARVR